MRSPKLHPEARALLEMMEALGRPPIENLPLAEARQTVREGSKLTGGEPEPLAHIESLSIPGPAGPVPIRVYAAGNGGSRPCLVYFHGGGYVLCDLDTHDTICRAIAKQSGAVVVAVDYRLAPEHKFPAALDDCLAATLWVCANTERLGVDARRIAVGGDSAGGNLATVVAMKCRDAGGPALALQVLVYPVTNCSAFDTASHQEFAEDHYLTRSAIDFFMAQYFASPGDAERPDASPLLASDLRHLPPALIITGECDPLRDEGEAYAKRLEEAGVSVTCTRYAGMFHPFFSMPGVLSDARTAIQQVASAVGSMAPAALRASRGTA
jgi:acetyl esterase